MAEKITYHTAELFPVPGITGLGKKSPEGVPVVRFQYRNLPELLAAIPHAAPRDALDDSIWSAGDMVAFYGTQSFGEAVDLANNGWVDGAQQAQEISAKLALARPTRNRMSRQCFVAGALPDVARAIAGNPAHMRQAKPREVAGKVATLVVDINGAANIEANRFMLNAVCAAAVVDAMETAGFRVEVIARNTSTESAVTVDAAIVAKEADEPVDLSKLAFICGHAGMFRRLMFALRASHPAARPITSTLGYSCCSVADPESGLYVVPAIKNNMPESEDVAEIFDGMVAALREQGCPGFAE